MLIEKGKDKKTGETCSVGSGVNSGIPQLFSNISTKTERERYEISAFTKYMTEGKFPPKKSKSKASPKKVVESGKTTETVVDDVIQRPSKKRRTVSTVSKKSSKDQSSTKKVHKKPIEKDQIVDDRPTGHKSDTSSRHVVKPSQKPIPPRPEPIYTKQDSSSNEESDSQSSSDDEDNKIAHDE